MEHLIHKGVRIPLIGLGTYGFGLTLLIPQNATATEKVKLLSEIL